MPDEPDPPRKFYKLKEAEFVRVNAPTNEPDAADVHAILRGNREKADAAGLNELTPKPKRSSRRKRDYWIMFVLVNGFFGAVLRFYGPRSIPGIYAIAGITLFTCALTWIMWFLMDDY
ncbi:MAG TPA: hypothetical protein VHO24_01515 [Opitutaceae bacterium]|nr:hypothetical protein [Opitutaceae bacterium]